MQEAWAVSPCIPLYLAQEMQEMGGLQTLVGVLGLAARQPRTMAGACAAL